MMSYVLYFLITILITVSVKMWKLWTMRIRKKVKHGMCWRLLFTKFMELSVCIYDVWPEIWTNLYGSRFTKTPFVIAWITSAVTSILYNRLAR